MRIILIAILCLCLIPATVLGELRKLNKTEMESVRMEGTTTVSFAPSQDGESLQSTIERNELTKIQPSTQETELRQRLQVQAQLRIYTESLSNISLPNK